MIKNIIFILIFVLIWIAIISFYGFYFSIHPKKYTTSINPASLNLKYENITFKTRDNIEIKGWFIPSKNKTNNTIIVCHGYPFDKGNVLSYASFLHEKYNLLFFDFRAMGESQGKFTSAGYYEKEDLLVVIEYLKNRGSENIGALGFSMGAAVILMADSKDIKAIVADSSYANIDMMINSMYRQFYVFKYPFVYLTRLYTKLFLKFDTDDVSPLKKIKNIETPILLIHGDRDNQINVKNSILLNKANPNTELWIIENAEHGQAHSVLGEEYEDKLIQFFDKNLGDKK